LDGLLSFFLEEIPMTAQFPTHLVCNAHLDPVWLWEWEEGAAAAISTFRTAADLCEEFEGFIFNHNEALLYRWVEEYEPALFKRIQGLVKAGKWHIMGGWYLQPDCNMPSGEAFVRQALLGPCYFQEKFGARPTTAINFDPFGHSRGLVQILAGWWERARWS
jgi:alpha-mannosidase